MNSFDGFMNVGNGGCGCGNVFGGNMLWLLLLCCCGNCNSCLCDILPLLLILSCCCNGNKPANGCN